MVDGMREAHNTHAAGFVVCFNCFVDVRGTNTIVMDDERLTPTNRFIHTTRKLQSKNKWLAIVAMKYISYFLRSIAFDALMSSRTCDSISITVHILNWLMMFANGCAIFVRHRTQTQNQMIIMFWFRAHVVCTRSHTHSSCLSVPFFFLFAMQKMSNYYYVCVFSVAIQYHSIRSGVSRFSMRLKKQKATQRLCGWKRLTTIIYCKKFAFRMATIDGDRSRLKSLFRWNLFCSLDLIRVMMSRQSRAHKSCDTRLSCVWSWPIIVQLRWKGGN